MALYDIHHSCGHTTEQQIYGTNVRGEREQQAQRLGAQPCAACRRGQYNEENKASAERAETEGWPELTGTRKQIAWAQSLRAKAIDRATAEVTETHGDNHELLKLTVSLLLRETQAAWWINERFQRSWLGYFGRPRVFPEWVEAAAPKGVPNRFEPIEDDMENIEDEIDLVRVVLAAEHALWAGAITAAQWNEVWEKTRRIRLRLESDQ